MSFVSATHERIFFAGRYLWGDEAFKDLIKTQFDGQIPEPGQAGWFQFVMICGNAPHDRWLRAYFPQAGKWNALPPLSKLPAFPKALASADYFMPYDRQRPNSGEPFDIGFWSKSDARCPYQFTENANSWENGRALAQTDKGELYKKYVAACRAVTREEWGSEAKLP